MRPAFFSSHPAVGFCFFAAVVGFTMFLMRPFFPAVSLLGAAGCLILLKGPRALRRDVPFALMLVPVAAAFNLLFVHEGRTVLFTLFGARFTFESVCYGAAAGAVLAAVLLWFSCLNAGMSADRLLSLFGRRLPALTLTVSMTLRLVPRLYREARAVAAAQKTLGMDAAAGSLRQRAQSGMRILSILLTWALENAIETADSMKARGYGLPGRTTYSNFRFTRRDARLLILLGVLTAVCAAGCFAGAARFPYYPAIRPNGALPAWAAAAWLLLCLFPFIPQAGEALKWRYLKLRT